MASAGSALMNIHLALPYHPGRDSEDDKENQASDLEHIISRAQGHVTRLGWEAQRQRPRAGGLLVICRDGACYPEGHWRLGGKHHLPPGGSTHLAPPAGRRLAELLSYTMGRVHRPLFLPRSGTPSLLTRRNRRRRGDNQPRYLESFDRSPGACASQGRTTASA